MADRLATLNGVDHYRILGVAPTASRDEIRRAYLALARRYHPDRADPRTADPDVEPGGGADRSARMAAVNHAWRVLGDADSRAAYDRRLRQAAPSPARPAPPAPPTTPVQDEPVDLDEPAADTIEGTPLQLALRVLPWVVIALALLGVFVFSAYAGPGGEPTPRPIDPGSCVLAGTGPDDLSVVPCDQPNDGRVVEVLPLGRECSDRRALTLPSPGAPGIICLETTLRTRSR